MTKQEVLNLYNTLVILSKNSSSPNLDCLNKFRRPKVHTDFGEFTKLGNNIIKHIESIIDDNVVLSDITDEYIKVEYVFSDRYLLIDRQLLEFRIKLMNKYNLERLLSIMKGLFIYKREMELLDELIQKYPSETREIVSKNGQLQIYMPIG